MLCNARKLKKTWCFTIGPCGRWYWKKSIFHSIGFFHSFLQPDASIYCTYTPFFKNEKVDDQTLKFGDEKKFSEKIDFDHQFALVKCFSTNFLNRQIFRREFANGWSENCHKLLGGKFKSSAGKASPDRPNVLLFGIDSMSMSNYKRQMPKVNSIDLSNRTSEHLFQ